MEPLPKKTVRFAQLISDSGRPEIVTLWAPPETNRDFMKAVKENRVLTLIQRNVGSKTDYGLIGFFKEQQVSYLVFPKRLAHAHETKVIGIKYEELGESGAARPVREQLPRGSRHSISKKKTGFEKELKPKQARNSW